jgi:uncharacterized protein YjbJ (UPF0337 family)
MNTKAIEKNWAEIKGQVKSKWTKFNDEDVESVKGDLSQLSGKIQKVYGIAKDHADRQYDEFKKSVQSLVTLEIGTEVPKLSPNTALPKPNLVATPQAIKATEPAIAKDSKVG